jgi:hypothetical protein
MKPATPFCTSLALVVLLGAFGARAGALESAHKSEFAASKGTRNIFWPVGWSPTAPVQATPSPAAPTQVIPTIDPSQFVVSSILLGAEKLAVVNGREVVEGSGIPLPGGAVAKVIAIRDGAILLQIGKQDPVAIPLKAR